MTEAEWLASVDPQLMLKGIGDRPGADRKLRLFAVACCRRFWEVIPDGPGRRALEAHEAFADGLVDESALGAAIAEVEDADRQSPNEELPTIGAATLTAVASVGYPHRPENRVGFPLRPEDVVFWAANVAGNRALHVHHDPESYAQLSEDDQYDACVEWFHPAGSAEEAIHADLLREVIGNPFRPPIIDPAWLTWNNGVIPGLARSSYKDKEFDRLPILADALEEAGCSDPAILDHCRREGGHVRGCWVLDALLGRV